MQGKVGIRNKGVWEEIEKLNELNNWDVIIMTETTVLLRLSCGYNKIMLAHFLRKILQIVPISDLIPTHCHTFRAL